MTGWVNNAAIFRDADLHTSSPDEVLTLINANLAPVIVRLIDRVSTVPKTSLLAGR